MLKARVEEIEETMKDTLESVDKLQADLDHSNSEKAKLGRQARATKENA